MSIIRQANDWLTVEARKDSAMVGAVLRRTSINGYIGWVGYGNLGDEAVFQALQSLFPECNLTPYRTSDPMHSLLRLSRREPPLLNAVLGGGTLIIQSPNWLNESVYVVSKNIPIFCLGTGVAPERSLDTPPNVQGNLMGEWARILEKFVYVGVRGPLSQAYLAKAGLNVEIVGDSALSLAKTQFRQKKFKRLWVSMSRMGPMGSCSESTQD